MIRLKRAYEAAEESDGTRYLVERLWPRGVKKTELRIHGWLKDAAPSTGLRQWFGHEPGRWDEFRRRYAAELDAYPEALEPVLKAARHGGVTLVYSSRDQEHNNAVALAEYAGRKLKGKTARRGPGRKNKANRSGGRWRKTKDNLQAGM